MTRLPKLYISNFVEVHELENSVPSILAYYKSQYYQDDGSVKTHIASQPCFIHHWKVDNLEHLNNLLMQSFVSSIIGYDYEFEKVESVDPSSYQSVKLKVLMKEITEANISVCEKTADPESYIIVSKNTMDKIDEHFKIRFEVGKFVVNRFMPDDYLIIGRKSSDPSENSFQIFWGIDGNLKYTKVGMVATETASSHFKVLKIA